MAMNRQEIPSAEFPLVFLINLDANQMRHNLSETAIMVPFDPDNLGFSLGIRELSNFGEKSPMMLLQAPEIEVAEDVTQEDQPAETCRSQQLQRLACEAYFGPEVQIRDDQGFRNNRLHRAQNTCTQISAGERQVKIALRRIPG